ncbi:cell division protein DamX [Vibrio sp. MACH09]|uniref:SPOR domain-containing protein n=1 Tax=Vibrio sp. MACH09 TaxID=3025122 RepID=UPI002794B61C|nr:AAA family ATPase [Vibrio sp. MACH09]GLO59687.1 cell division protein DamX [Vibrio sp. MACH09]
MSLAHELRVLDLESQIDLLDRLRLLTRFGSNLTNISGNKGSGKSWIAQRYLEAWSQDKNQSLLMCHPSQTDAQKRAIILNQIVPDPLFNEQDTIVNSFARMMADQTCDVVIVIDDAQMLSDTVLAELWTLVQEAQAIPAWNINVVLFTQGDRLDAVLSRLSYGQETKPLALEVESLSQNEVDLFVELLVVKYVSGEDAKKAIRTQATKAQPLPGALMMLGERKVEKRIIIRSIIGSPIKIAVAVLVLLLCIAVGYLWLFTQAVPEGDIVSDSQMVTSNTEETSTGEQLVLSTDSSENNQDASTAETAEVGHAASETSMASDALTGTIDESDLPPSIPENVASVGQSDDGQRVVVPSTVVDALLEGEEANTQVIDDAFKAATDKAANEQLLKESLESIAVPETVVITTEPDASTVEQPLESVELEREENSPPLVTFSFSKQELLAVSDRNYTLQLAALLSLDDVQSFIDKHALQDKVRVYPTLRNNTQWYIVTYKDFSTIQAARNARVELPVSVQLLEPWAKSMLQVHREIELAN